MPDSGMEYADGELTKVDVNLDNAKWRVDWMIGPRWSEMSYICIGKEDLSKTLAKLALLDNLTTVRVNIRDNVEDEDDEV